MFTLWDKDQEKDFFIKSLEFATPEQLFYITKNYDGAKTTLQSSREKMRV